MSRVKSFTLGHKTLVPPLLLPTIIAWNFGAENNHPFFIQSLGKKNQSLENSLEKWQEDIWTLNNWTLNNWTLDDWTLDSWTFVKLNIYQLNSGQMIFLVSFLNAIELLGTELWNWTSRQQNFFDIGTLRCQDFTCRKLSCLEFICCLLGVGKIVTIFAPK